MMIEESIKSYKEERIGCVSNNSSQVKNGTG